MIAKKAAATSMQKVRSAIEWTAAAYNSVLATPVAKDFDKLLQSLTDQTATVYSKAMDAEYLRTHIGGGWHRLFDGGHSPVGAWRAIRSVSPDASVIESTRHYLNEYWKDLVTVRGMPIATFDKEWLDATTVTLREALHVSPEWIKDLLTITATEAAGGIAGLAAMLISLRANDPDRYAQLLGSLGVSATASGNPILVAIVLSAALVTAVKVAAEGRNLTAAERFKRVGKLVAGKSDKIAKGATLTSVSIAAAAGAIAVAGAPIGLAVGFGVGVGGQIAWKQLEDLAQRRRVRACIEAMLTEASRARLALPSPAN